MTEIQMKLSPINTALAVNEAAKDAEASKVINVTTFATLFGFGLPVRMEAETFGVLVTRRPGASTADVRPYERSRLLATLATVVPYLGCCDEEPCQAEHWVIPSDSMDGLARCMWVQLAIEGDGYVISMPQH